MGKGREESGWWQGALCHGLLPWAVEVNILQNHAPGWAG